MPAQLHLLNSANQISHVKRKIESTFVQGLASIEALIKVSNVDVVVYRDSRLVIPETGVGGYSPSHDRVFIAVDPEHSSFEEHFERNFISILGHELHHCARWMMPGYGTTLKEAIVSEGLACHFETELCDGTVPFYAQCLDNQEQIQVLTEFENSCNSPAYDHAAWFYGSGYLPRQAGYSLGFAIVAAYIAVHGFPASKLTNLPADEFFTTPPNKWFKPFASLTGTG